MRITVVGVIVIVAGIVVVVLMLESLLETEKPNHLEEDLPGGPAKITGSTGV